MSTVHLQKRITPFTPYLKDIDKFILGLKNVFSEQECQDLINRSEQHTYEAALVNLEEGYVVDKTVRDSGRVMLDDHSFAAEIYGRVRSWLPQEIMGLTLSGVNERLRFLRYDVSQQFAPHYDGNFERPDGSEISFVTIQIYLNGGEGQLEGGETTFFDAEGNEQCKIRPCSGLVLLFDHAMLHEGTPVRQGRKYVIRSDIMYSWRDERVLT
ncbi:TPA: hypothetical protein ACH3X2_011407 [Trebouxia sp. C0005]